MCVNGFSFFDIYQIVTVRTNTKKTRKNNQIDDVFIYIHHQKRTRRRKKHESRQV